MKTIAYIDGGNLYHGLLRGSPDCKWLDIAALVRAMFVHALLDANHKLVAVKYFVSRTKTYPHDPMSVERQNIYIQALLAHGEVEVVEGYYNKNKAWVPSFFFSFSGRSQQVATLPFLLWGAERRNQALKVRICGARTALLSLFSKSQICTVLY